MNERYSSNIKFAKRNNKLMFHISFVGYTEKWQYIDVTNRLSKFDKLIWLSVISALKTECTMEGK